MSLSRALMMTIALAGCRHRVSLPSVVSAPATSPQTVWVAAGVSPPNVDTPIVWFGDVGGVVADTPICHATRRRGPLWQQMDVAGVRFICVADPDRLSKRERLKQRFQAPMSASPTSGMPLVIAASLPMDRTSPVTDDLEAFSDALALQMRIRRGPTSALTLGESEWGPPTVVIGPDAAIELSVTNGQTTARLGDETLTIGEMGAWIVVRSAD